MDSEELLSSAKGSIVNLGEPAFDRDLERMAGLDRANDQDTARLAVEELLREMYGQFTQFGTISLCEINSRPEVDQLRRQFGEKVDTALEMILFTKFNELCDHNLERERLMDGDAGTPEFEEEFELRSQAFELFKQN